MILIKHLQMDLILALNNPLVVGMPLNKANQAKPNHVTLMLSIPSSNRQYKKGPTDKIATNKAFDID